MTAPEQPPAPPEQGAAPVGRERLRELALAATPGPWSATGHSNGVWKSGIHAHPQDMPVATVPPSRMATDAPYIAAACPATVLGLLDALAKAEAGWLASALENNRLALENERLTAEAKRWRRMATGENE